MKERLVNPADWDGPADLPPDWLIVNAPRPLLGERTWTGQYRHGIHYAANPTEITGTWGWAADDAYLITFITNEEIEKRVTAKLAEHGLKSPEDVGATFEEVAVGILQLPWVATEREG